MSTKSYKVVESTLIADNKLVQILPFIQPGNRSLKAFSISAGDSHFPSLPSTPSAGVGIVSRLFGVEISVLLSTLATSAGSVRTK